MNPDGSVNCTLPHNQPCTRQHMADEDEFKAFLKFLLWALAFAIGFAIAGWLEYANKPQHVTKTVQDVTKTITKTNTVTKTVPAVFKFVPGESVYVNDQGWTAGHVQAVQNNNTYVVKESNGSINSYSASDIATTEKP